jgi:hypothetical protein
MSQNESIKRFGINEVEQMYKTVDQTQRRVFYV